MLSSRFDPGLDAASPFACGSVSLRAASSRCRRIDAPISTKAMMMLSLRRSSIIRPRSSVHRFSDNNTVLGPRLRVDARGDDVLVLQGADLQRGCGVGV